MNTPGLARLYRVRDVCELTRLHERTVRRRMHAGEFGPVLRIGSELRVTETGVCAFLSRLSRDAR